MEVGLYDTILVVAYLGFSFSALWLILRNMSKGIEPKKTEFPPPPKFEDLTSPPIHYTTWEYTVPLIDLSDKYMEELWEGLAKHCPSPEEIEKMTGDEAYQAFLDCLEKYKEEHGLEDIEENDEEDNKV